MKSKSFEWDPVKATNNERKHGLSFIEAVSIFDDPFALTIQDEKHSTKEKRFWLVGDADGQVMIVVFTLRKITDDWTYRLISARKANKRERALYEINKRIPI